ncbi:hybrid sensor histidine kinase/response regulator [Vreelandella malpeensis]|uniref:histidine kinase n=1 Tax=Vreelandella malpeensis TaxID=1172368 RepID=A0ABS8DP21_9GAMM|nr:NahK/ErcS family hybrid sensor histidine kinase/response regulator [Halomonas malpeensis]MCB8888033.1 hybrid sensor histidine kinase/response regulator [Halomonas malpeensis]
MFHGGLLVAVSLLYIAVLFGIAWFGDRRARTRGASRRRPLIYSLALAIYCTSWTFYGAVGQAATAGWSFASIFVGPVLTFLLFWPVLAKMIRVAKHQNVTSIADFIASRYGKTQSLAAFASLVALIGTLPYIALQLKAVSTTFSVLTENDTGGGALFNDTAFYVALVMAVFAILFGTRHTDATEHHEGLIHAVAFESLVKLFAFVVLGVFVTWGMFDGLGALMAHAESELALQRQLANQDFGQSFWAQTLLAMLAIICLPRQFHVTVVENIHPDDATKARWLFPLYILAIAFFVVPLAAAGLWLFSDTAIEPDTYVLALAMESGHTWLTLLTFIGGFSAATGMVIVAAVAVSIMISNEIVIPALFRLRWFDTKARDYGRLVLRARRLTIVAVLALAYGFYQLIAEFTSLASIGMLSFAAAAQFAPAVIGGLYWKRGNRLGVIVGMNAGFAIWAYSLLMPAMINAGVLPAAWLAGGPLGIGWLSPTALFNLNLGGDSFTHGVMLSLGVNLFCYIFVSQISSQRVVERIQASLFVDSVETRQTSVNRPWTGATTVGDLKVLCERFLGAGQVDRAFEDYARRTAKPLDDGARASIDVIQFTERFLASVLGASSARIVVNSALQGRGIGISDVISIVDEASQVLEFNRALLQATIENINQGISVVDQNLRLVVWNQRYLELFRFPDHLIRVSAPIDRIFRYNAHNGEYGPGDPEEHVELLLDNIRQGQPHRYVRYRQDGSVLEVQGTPMPGGGFVYTYQDITQQKRIEEALIRSENNIRIYTDNVPALIAYFDKESRYLFTNRAYEQAFAIDRNAVIGRRFEDVLPVKQAEERLPWVKRALAGERVSFEVAMRVDSRMRYMLVTYTPHFGDSQSILGFFALYQDITERRQAEIALQETNETLEERVRERTQALSKANAALRQENRVRAEAEQALRQAKQLAEDANASKTRFLAAASHDLLQPLNAARLFTSALMQNEPESANQRTIGHIDNSLQAAEELLGTLLDISKLDAGALTPRRSHFALSDIVRPLRAEFDVMADERGLDLNVVATSLWVDSDPQMLRRIVQNFLSNALRYTQQGRVLLGCRRQGERLSIEVWDSGPGIPESKLTEIFQEFRRLDQVSRHKESEKGLGLGLSIADRMSRVLDHPIKVRSKEGSGTVFSVSVPVVASREAAPATQEAPTRRGGNKLAGARIVCIDNETLILEGMSAMLGGWGCEVFTATSIGGAKSILRNMDGDPDAILADYHLDNEVTGLMALEALDERLEGAVPGIVITADRTEDVSELIKRAGYQLLLKPVKPAALRALLTRTLQASRART